ncbi:MAG TPA: ATP-binding cassette domain-containing protein [Candidatus Acidoferrales bacterium]|nr:ATP-binding cassette domain-containing protein [Candidatus Acidoferrales bacterium]
MTPVLELRDVGVRYGELWGARDVSFDLYPGEVLGIVGESGSGKSTVVACANLDLAPTTGTVKILGQDVTGLRGAQRRAVRSQSTGIVYQTPQQGLDLSLTAGGNIAERMLGAGLREYEHVRARALQYHTAMELPADRLDTTTRLFSGGMRQRVQLARALVTNPPLLLLDEPTSGLDVSVQARILDLIRGLQAEHGFAMLVVSHDLAVIRMLAERLIVMHQGSIVEHGLTDRVLGDPQHPYTQLLVSSQLVVA